MQRQPGHPHGPVHAKANTDIAKYSLGSHCKRSSTKKNELKSADQKNRRYSREFFEAGSRVVVQDQIAHKWTKRGTAVSSRPTHTDQGARSYMIQMEDGRTYTRNTRFITREPQSAGQPEGEQAGQDVMSAE